MEDCCQSISSVLNQAKGVGNRQIFFTICLFLFDYIFMSEKNSLEILLEKNSIPNLVFHLGIPAMFGQFFNLLYSIVDRIFVSQIPETGNISLASIGICAPALTAITAFAYMIGIGGSSCMSISLGQKDLKQAQKFLGNSLVLLICISIILTLLIILIKKPFLYLLGSSKIMYPYANTYFTIYICGILASLCGTGLNQFLLAQGFSRQGMVAVIIGAISNLILDPIFIFIFHMDIAGAALATVISQYLMACYVIWQLLTPKVPVHLGLFKCNNVICRQIISIGFMSFLITLMDNLIIILLNVVLRKYGGSERGDQLITCATIIQSFVTIVCCPSQGITSGCGTIFSYHYGARHYDKICQTFTWVFLLCATYIGLLWFSIQMAPQTFIKLFLNDTNFSNQAAFCLRIYTMALIGVAVQYALVDGLTAMGKIKFALPLSLFRKLIYTICIFLIPLLSDVSYVFLAGTISDTIGGIFSIILFFGVITPRLKKELLMS